MYKQGFFKTHPEEKKNLTPEVLSRIEKAVNIILDYSLGVKTKQEFIEDIAKINCTWKERQYVREIFNDAYKMLENDDYYYKHDKHMAYLNQVEANLYLNEKLTIWQFMDELKKYNLTDNEKTYFAQQYLRRLEADKNKSEEQTGEECPKGFIRND